VAGAADGSGWLEREIQGEYEQIRDAALADAQKPFSNEDFERQVADMRTFARRRSDSVTRQVTDAAAGIARAQSRRRR
jgi:hypothetical protein